MSLRVKVQPAEEPVSLDEAKDHLRVDVVDDDALIAVTVMAARTYLERTYDLPLTTQTLVLGMDAFPASGTIELIGPVQSVTSITYLDANGATQTLANTNYVVDTDSAPARIALALNKTWPTTASLPLAVKVEYIAGFGGPEQVPSDILAAVKLIVGHLYENREQNLIDRATALELPLGVEALMAPYAPNLVV